MEFIKNWLKRFGVIKPLSLPQSNGVSSWMEEMNTWLVALEQVASNFSHFIIEHRIPAQAVLVDLHNTTCPSCQRADALANNSHSSSESKQAGQGTPIPIPLPNS